MALYPYNSQLAPAVGGGFGGLPRRRDTSAAGASASTSKQWVARAILSAGITNRSIEYAVGRLLSAKSSSGNTLCIPLNAAGQFQSGFAVRAADSPVAGSYSGYSFPADDLLGVSGAGLSTGQAALSLLDPLTGQRVSGFDIGVAASGVNAPRVACKSSDGGFFIAYGHATGPSIQVAKVNAAFALQWVRQIATSISTGARLFPTSSGGVVLFAGSAQITVFDSAGATVANASVSMSRASVGSDGSVFFISSVSSVTPVIGKINPGLSAFTFRNQYAYSDVASISAFNPYDVLALPDGGCIASGYITDTSGQDIPRIIRVDSSGALVWSKQISPSYLTTSRGANGAYLLADETGSFFFAVSAISDGVSSGHAMVAKLSLSNPSGSYGLADVAAAAATASSSAGSITAGAAISTPTNPTVATVGAGTVLAAATQFQAAYSIVNTQSPQLPIFATVVEP